MTTFMILLLLALTPMHCMSMPFVIVTSGKPKCVTVPSPGGTSLEIFYECPDLILNKHEKGYGKVWISSVLRPSKKESDYTTHRPPPGIKKVHQPTSIELKKKSGSFVHQVEVDGTVDVCIRASPASTGNPLLFGLKVEKKGNEQADIHFNVDKENQDTTSAAHHHLSKMEEEAVLLQRYMKDILNEADFSKEREVGFHGQTVAMHSATMWWPVMHLSVLIVTGFTQASHIVRFFKSRRII